MTLLSTAKELWDSTVFDIKCLIGKAKRCIKTNSNRSYEDFLLESSISQQCFVKLVTGFEIYCKGRFLEIESELPFRGKIPQFDLLLSKFAREIKTVYKVFAYAEIHGTSILEASVSLPRRGQRGLINFQNWDDCKTAYNLCYNIKFGEILDLKSDALDRVRRYILFRHKVIHSSQKATMIDVKKGSKKESIVVTFDVAESALKDFAEFIEKLHIQTERITKT